MKKYGALLAILIISIIAAQLVVISALDIDISKKDVSSMAIVELNKPAIFDITINNNGDEAEILQIYTLISRVNLEPKDSFIVEQESSKTIEVKAYPRNIPGSFSFEYKIKNAGGEIKTDNLAMSIVRLKDAFDIYSENIYPGLKKATIHFENKGGHSFSNMQARFLSAFFDSTQAFSLGPYEKKEFEIDIDEGKTGELFAGPYIMDTKLTIEGKDADTSNIFEFTEQPGIKTTESSEGFINKRYEITKDNQGNTPIDIEILVKKNLLASWFTTFSMAPSNQDKVGFYTYSIFKKTIEPGESLTIVTRTNWWFLILIVVGIILIWYLTRKYVTTKLVLTKRVSFVKTKGGEFALKISLIAKARDSIEKLRIIDRLPAMVKIYEKYGPVTPDKIDEKNKRIEWSVENLRKGEERIFSYIIYSKIGIVGRFELPTAKALCETHGKLKEFTSNRAFFINEPDAKKKMA